MFKLRDLLAVMYEGDGGSGGGGDGQGSSGQKQGEGGGSGEASGSGQQKQGEQKPPWESDEKFDPERAWKLITDLRADRDKVKGERDGLQSKVAEHERANESAAEKAEREKAEALDRATKAEGSALRLEVAMDKAPDGMTLAQVRKLAKRLTGTTKEELETDADELFADFAPSGNEGGGGNGRQRPREALRPGAAPSSEPEETDPRKLAAKVPQY